MVIIFIIFIFFTMLAHFQVGPRLPLLDPRSPLIQVTLFIIHKVMALRPTCQQLVPDYGTTSHGIMMTWLK